MQRDSKHCSPAARLALALAGAWLWIAAPLPAAEPALTGDRVPTKDGDLIIHPVNHATLMLGWKDVIICVDPVGGAARFVGLPRANLILVTDIHGDHLNADTIQAVATDKAPLITSLAASKQLPVTLFARTTALTNGQSTTVLGLTVEAIPAYNLTAERTKFHPGGRGNGYLLTLGGRRVYLSGDTEDTTELRALRNIDVAFLCMNLPYTMEVDQSASAVRAFRPKIVYPYHYRGSDLEKFKKLVGDDIGVEVRLRNWY